MSDWNLTLGDCIDGMSELPDMSCDHVICDPPYSEHVHTKARTDGGAVYDIDFTHLSDSLRDECSRQFARICKRWVIVFCEEEGAHLWRSALTSAGLDYVRTGRWIRVGNMPQITGDRPAQGDEAIVIAHRPGRKKWNGGGKAGLWTFPKANHDGPERLHPTQKPVALMEALVRDFTAPGDLILDPFSGSGTTGVAAIRLGRRFIGFERDPKYHATATRRLAKTREQLGLFAEGA